MSAETLQWLNTNTLIGFTDKRGEAWHYRADLQSTEPNHYPGAIPVDDVLRRLFDFTVEPASIYVIDPDSPLGITEVPGRKAWQASDNGDVLGIFSDGYRGHQYPDWLVSNVANILDDDLGIGSAGLLRNRAQAWVSVEVPDTITTPEGVAFRPHLIAATSFDGSLATTYKRSSQVVVCDNTLSAGLNGKGEVFRVKHTRHSSLRITDAREALAIVHQVADDFAAEVARLCNWSVTDQQWSRLLDALVPVPDDQGRSRTIAEHKRAALNRLYRRDVRAATWTGTAFGVLQAFNTYEHHEGTVRNVAHRAERNFARAITGQSDKADAEVLDTLALVTA